MGAETIATRYRTNASNATYSKSNASKKIRQSKSSRSYAISSHSKHFVEHDYHDHIYDPIVGEMVPDKNGVHKRSRVHRGGVSQPFPEKLHYMLSNIDGEGLSDIVSWQPHGRCFVVHKPKEFVDRIMPRYFKQTKLTSFQRQLNLYGFSRLTAGVDRGGYYHELFIRGRMDLCIRMTRTRVKGNGSKGASSPETEPNFYTMTPCSEANPLVLSTAKKTQATNEIAVITDSDSEDDIPMEIIEPATTSHKGAHLSDIPSSPFPVISPVLEPQRMVSPTNSPDFPDLIDLLPIPCEVSLPDVHSGDKLLFEGLPFHYLESKDLEDGLLLEM